MSMLRGLYRRAKLVKCSFSETGASITLNVSDSRFASQYVINLPARHLGMTFSNKPSTSNSGSCPSQAKKPNNAQLLPVCEIKVESHLWNNSASEGYYRNEWKQEKGRRRSQHAGDGCQFNFEQKETFRVPLIDTFGIIGTAVAVGIDVRTRFNDYNSSKRHGINDLCQSHHNCFNPYASVQPVSTGHGFPTQESNLSQVLDLVDKKAKACVENDSRLTTIQYCGACSMCGSLYDKLLQFYWNRFLSVPTSAALNIFPRRAAAVPKVTVGPFDTTAEEEESDQDYVDGCDGPPTPRELHFDSVFADVSSGASVSEEGQPPSQFDASRTRQRKKSVFIRIPEDAEDKSLEENLTADSTKSECVSHSSQRSGTPESGFDSAKSTSQPSSPPVPNVKEEEQEDIAAVFRMASIEYADQLNNLVGISLMNGHKPDEAMQCWSSCETSSRAFFNMGVAYESGRHAKNAKPDLDRAHDCYALAASMGHRDAIFNLSLFYLYGKGKVAVNVEYGIALLEKAADKGVESARTFCAELRHKQQIEEIRDGLLRKASQVGTGNRPLRTSVIRPSASMIGSATPHLKPNHATSSGGRLRRNHSAPSLFDLHKSSSPIVVASK